MRDDGGLRERERERELKADGGEGRDEPVAPHIMETQTDEE